MADEDELEAIRQRKLQELQIGQQQAFQREEMAAQNRAARAVVLRRILTPEARERLARIEMAYPDLTESIEAQLIQLAQSGRVTEMIDDATLQQILRRIIPRKREINIERR